MKTSVVSIERSNFDIVISTTTVLVEIIGDSNILLVPLADPCCQSRTGDPSASWKTLFYFCCVD